MWLIQWLDGLLIAPFRWADDPMVGFWLGTMVLVALVVLIGEASRALGLWLNGDVEGRSRSEVVRYHGLSMAALKSGDRDAYSATNRMATEALNRWMGFSMTTALAILWPAFLAAGWLHLRFDGVVLAEVDELGLQVGAVGAFALCFVLARLVMARLQRSTEPEEAS